MQGEERESQCVQVVRIFGRLRSLQKIFTAISASIIPVMNSFFIMFITTCICKSRPLKQNVWSLSLPAPQANKLGIICPMKEKCFCTLTAP